MIISIDAEKTFDKVQHLFTIKTLSKVGAEGACLNIIKVIYEKPQPISYSMGKAKSFSTKIRNKARMSTFTTSIQHGIGSPTHRDQTRKRNKRHPNWKGGSKNVIVCRKHDTVHRKPYKLLEKLLNLIKCLWQNSGYKVNIHKSKAFCTQTMKYQKQKSGKQSHLIQQQEK